MDKLEYISGDLVYIHGSLRIISNCDGYYATYYDENESLQEVNVNVIEDIPITPEILEKNGWDKEEKDGSVFSLSEAFMGGVLITKWRCRHEYSNTSKSPLPFLRKKMLPMRLLES